MNADTNDFILMLESKVKSIQRDICDQTPTMNLHKDLVYLNNWLYLARFIDDLPLSAEIQNYLSDNKDKLMILFPLEFDDNIRKIFEHSGLVLSI